MLDPEFEGTYKEPPMKRVIICNVHNHMKCENCLLTTAGIQQPEPTPTARTQLLKLAERMVKALEKTQQYFDKKLKTPELFPPGYNLWPLLLQRFVIMESEICQFRNVDFVLCAPNFTAD